MSIELLNTYLKWIIVICIAIGVVLFLTYALIKKKKVNIKSQNEDNDDYSAYERKDVAEFLDFEDIVDTVNGGVVVVKKGSRYIALLATVGTEWLTASHEDRLRRINAERARTRIIDKPIQTFQYSQPVSMNTYIDRYQTRSRELIEKVLNKKAEFEELRAKLDYVSDEDMDDYYAEVVKKRKELYSLDWQRKNIDAQIHYMEQISGEYSNPEAHICYVIEWVYEPLSFTEQLDDDGIWEQACKELNNICNSHIAALSESSVYARRMTKAEIIEAIRQQTHPVTSNLYDIDTVIGGNEEMVIESDVADYNALVIGQKETDALKKEMAILDKDKMERYKELLNQNVRVAIKCRKCNKRVTIDMSNEQYMDYRSYLHGEGLIQDKLCELTDEQREIILSGFCSKCYEAEAEGASE